jgi:hypothetical protein
METPNRLTGEVLAGIMNEFSALRLSNGRKALAEHLGISKPSIDSYFSKKYLPFNYVDGVLLFIALKKFEPMKKLTDISPISGFPASYLMAKNDRGRSVTIEIGMGTDAKAGTSNADYFIHYNHRQIMLLEKEPISVEENHDILYHIKEVLKAHSKFNVEPVLKDSPENSIRFILDDEDCIESLKISIQGKNYLLKVSNF